MEFKKATKKGLRARVSFDGPTKSGKTIALLQFFRELGGKTAIIDTEEGTSRIYSDEYDFDILELNEDRSPRSYVDAIALAVKNGYQNIGIDSLSHAWAGKGGVLSIVDRAGNKPGNNKYTAWSTGTAEHQALVDALLGLRAKGINLGVTLRVKMEYVLETNDKGKQVPKKVGLKPIQRDELEYEFDVNASLNEEHLLTISGTRCSPLDGKEFRGKNSAAQMAEVFKAWMEDGGQIEKPATPVPMVAPAATAPTLGEMVIVRLLAGTAAEVEEGKARIKDKWGRLSKAEREFYTALVREAAARLQAAQQAPEPPPDFLEPTPPPPAAPEPAQDDREPIPPSIVTGLVQVGSSPPPPVNDTKTDPAPADGLASEQTMQDLVGSMRANGFKTKTAVEKYVEANAPGFVFNNLTEAAASMLLDKLGQMGLERLSAAK